MITIRTYATLTAVVGALILGGCAGTKAFTTAARSGETVTLAVGWNVNINRSNLSATITPPGGGAINYSIGDSRIRAVFNTYPDPVSRLVVGTETNQSLGYNANTNGTMLDATVTNYDKDWAQTMVLLDLPSGMSPGAATIDLKTGSTVVSSHQIEVLAGTSSANTFQGSTGALSAQQLATLERTTASVVTFSATTVPHSIQIDITRNVGVGVPWVANSRGDIKNISWSDNGSRIRVIITPVGGQALSHIEQFKFYIAGGVTGLSTTPVVTAYDVNGNVVSGVTATVQGL